LNKTISVVLIALSLLGLASVRLLENDLFYDPFIDYFKSNFQLQSLPELHKGLYLISTVSRYLINLLFTVFTIWLLYRSKEFVKATLWVHLFSFIILIAAFFILVALDDEWVKMTLFYIRRFLIHPILLFILVPGFYFISKSKSAP
jgi:exosortase F-associated protein